jgi:hypothetical protein
MKNETGIRTKDVRVSAHRARIYFLLGLHRQIMGIGFLNYSHKSVLNLNDVVDGF